jgi:leader peptidase (prepilin peptidase)/N-methyltransferase
MSPNLAMLLELADLLAVVCFASWFDIRERRIPTSVLVVGVLVLLVIRWTRHALSPWLVAQAAIGFGVIWFLHLAFRGRIGLGDAQLSAFLGIALGIGGWVVAVFVASSTGIAFVLIQTWRARMKISQSIPFAPFLAVGALFAFLACVLAFGDAPGVFPPLGFPVPPW